MKRMKAKEEVGTQEEEQQGGEEGERERKGKGEGERGQKQRRERRMEGEMETREKESSDTEALIPRPHLKVLCVSPGAHDRFYLILPRELDLIIAVHPHHCCSTD